MERIFLSTFVLFCVLFQEIFCLESNGTSNVEKSRILSRRKRYLIFPDGSSFQLVFCTQTHGYLQVGNIVWFGNTAALAWELPTDPMIFKSFKDFSELGPRRRNDLPQKHVYLVDEHGKILQKRPYRKKPIVNPAFAKRSVDAALSRETNDANIDIKAMHQEKETKTIKLSNVEFHRSGRKELYEKVEVLIDSLGWSGADCVLRLLCESGHQRGRQGSFLDEIVRVVFTLPKGEEFEDEHHRKYDKAHQHNGACMEKYPKCVNKLTGESLFEYS